MIDVNNHIQEKSLRKIRFHLPQPNYIKTKSQRTKKEAMFFGVQKELKPVIDREVMQTIIKTHASIFEKSEISELPKLYFRDRLSNRMEEFFETQRLRGWSDWRGEDG